MGSGEFEQALVESRLAAAALILWSRINGVEMVADTAFVLSFAAVLLAVFLPRRR